MFERLTKPKKLDKAKELFKDAVTADLHWQRIAREDFAFRDGDQWSSEEKQILADEMRPCLTFNLTKSSIDLIMGMNEDIRVKYMSTPVEPTDGFLSEVLNDIAYWLYDYNDLEDEEDNALESAAICGRGYLAVDFGPDPEKFGEIKLDVIQIPVSEIHVDPSCRRVNFNDASYICWDRWLTEEQFRMKYPKVGPKKIKELLDQEGTGESYPDGRASHAFAEPAWEENDNTDYEVEVDENFYDKQKNMIRVVHLEYWEVFKRYYTWNPEGQRFVEFDGKDLRGVKERFEAEFEEEFTYETVMDKKVKWLQFSGEDILYDDDAPMSFPGFSIIGMTAYRDVSGRTANHFGVVRLMKDPQREVNKRWSQTLHLMNHMMPGIYAEADAFVDDRQARASMKEAGSITFVQAGALTGGKIKDRIQAQFPSGIMQMEQFAQEIMKRITGINPDLLGQDRGRQEPGVVVRMRQQQGATLLKPLFKGFKKLQRDLFKRVLAIVGEFMPDEQILRILGQGDRYTIDKETGMITDQATEMTADLRAIRELDYNLTAEENPGSMTKRMMELALFMEMQNSGIPVDPTTVIEKLSLSASEKQRWLEFIAQQQEAEQEQQDAVMRQEIDFKDREISVDEQKNVLEFITDMAKINQMEVKDKQKMAMDLMDLDAGERQRITDFMSQVMQTVAQVNMAKENAATAKATANKGGTSDGKK